MALDPKAVRERVARAVAAALEDHNYVSPADVLVGTGLLDTRYVSAELSEKKRENLEQRLQQAPEIVVFQVLRDSKCGQCEAEIEQNDLLTLEAEKPLCMTCARLDARKAVVVRFSRARKRYERQGILVEKAALERAERELGLSSMTGPDLEVRRRSGDLPHRAAGRDYRTSAPKS